MICDSQSHLRYQNALVNYQKLSSQDSSLTLCAYCREHHIHHKGMKEWLTQNNLSIKPASRTSSKRPKPRTKRTNQDLFLEVTPPTEPMARHDHELKSINVSLIFSDGTHLNVPQLSIPQIAQKSRCIQQGGSMFGLTSTSRYYLCAQPIDMRNGINGLYKIVKSQMSLSPISGDIFIFVSRNRTNIKLLRWDTDGFILYHKRLERGTFEMPIYDTTSNTHTLSWSTFSLIMQGVNLKSVKYRKRFRIE